MRRHVGSTKYITILEPKSTMKFLAEVRMLVESITENLLHTTIPETRVGTIRRCPPDTRPVTLYQSPEAQMTN